MKRTVTALIAVILLVFVFVFGGVGVTARAARSALPGDALYSVKTRIEQARLSLAHDLSKEAELNMEFASTRLAEIGRLIEAGRYEEAVSLSTEFNAYIQKALQAVGELAKLDPVKAGELSAEITSKLLEYTQKLSAMLAGLPESVSNEIKNNFPAPELSPPGQGNENSNSNENANENEDTNENESVNENDDGGNQNDNGGDDIDHDDGNDDDRDGGNVNDHDGGDDDDGGGDNDHNGGGDNDSGDSDNENSSNGDG